MQVTSLSWGVKASFRAYVEMSGGVIETEGGATRAEDGAIRFPATTPAALVDGRPEGVYRFQGEVRFRAHGGMLSVKLADPALEIGPDAAVLTVADHGRRVTFARLDLAALSQDAGDLVIPTTLAPEGCYVLDNHYPQGTPIDPIRLTLGAD